MHTGDDMNKYLFFLVRERPAGGLITELYDEDDIVVSSSAYLTKGCNAIYSKLYACPTSDEQQREYGE